MIRTTILPLDASHLDGAIQLHAAAFPGTFLVRLGPRFLNFYYSIFINSDSEWSFVCIQEGRVVGSILGTDNALNFYRNLILHHFATLALMALSSLFMHPGLLRPLATRAWLYLGFIFRTKAPWLRKERPISHPFNRSKVLCRLLSICTAEEARSQGIGRALAEAFLRETKARGIHKVGLSLHKNNAVALHFYQESGWQEDLVSANAICLLRVLPEGGDATGSPELWAARGLGTGIEG